MTPYDSEHHNQARCVQQQDAYTALYLDGSEDAAFAELPRYTTPAYLDGYISSLKRLPTNPDGTICYGLPERTISSSRSPR